MAHSGKKPRRLSREGYTSRSTTGRFKQPSSKETTGYSVKTDMASLEKLETAGSSLSLSSLGDLTLKKKDKRGLFCETLLEQPVATDKVVVIPGIESLGPKQRERLRKEAARLKVTIVEPTFTSIRLQRTKTEDYVDPMLYEMGIYKDKADYEQTINQLADKINSGELKRREPDEE